MKIATRFGALALLLAAIVALQANAPAMAATPEQDGDYYTGFEQGLKPWAPAATRPGAFSLTRVTGENGCYDLAGNAYANLKGASDTQTSVGAGAAVTVATVDSAIPLPVGTWIGTSYPAVGLNTVRVAWTSRNTGDCEGCIPMVYIGTTAPRFTTQFTQMETPLGANWQSYDFGTALSVAEGEAVYVAIGWSGTEATVGLDCIYVQINSLSDPVPTPTTALADY